MLVNEPFIKSYYLIQRCKSLSDSEKILINYIIGWQTEGKECIGSNTYIAEELGWELRKLERIISELKKKSAGFDSHKITSERTGGYYNRTRKVVDVDALLSFIEQIKMESKPEPVVQQSEPDLNINFDEVPTVTLQEFKEMKVEPVVDPTPEPLIEREVMIEEPVMFEMEFSKQEPAPVAEQVSKEFAFTLFSSLKHPPSKIEKVINSHKGLTDTKREAILKWLPMYAEENAA